MVAEEQIEPVLIDNLSVHISVEVQLLLIVYELSIWENIGQFWLS